VDEADKLPKQKTLKALTKESISHKQPPTKKERKLNVTSSHGFDAHLF
jgi:hypothetical protein